MKATLEQNETNHAIRNATGHLESMAEAFEAIAALEAGAESVKVDGYEYTDADAVRENLQQSALSVEVRDGWRNPGEKSEGNADEYRILLTCGGPALRLVGELSEHGEPETAVLEYQDWGTPWTAYETTEEQDDNLLEFARLFYFGE